MIRLVKVNYFFDKKRICEITNGIGITSVFSRKSYQICGGGRIAAYMLPYNYIFIRNK